MLPFFQWVSRKFPSNSYDPLETNALRIENIEAENIESPKNRFYHDGVTYLIIVILQSLKRFKK